MNTKAQGRMKVLLAITALAGLYGCATTSPEGGEALAHHNWWNFYERGETLLERGDYPAARADFETALGLRSGAKFGYDQDMWRARTYGLHFVEGYFPHRELGVCLFNLGELEPAEQHLQTSLNQTPSGRAKHYLNLVRQRRLKGVQTAPPKIEFDAASQAAWTRQRRQAVAGVARADGYVADLKVGDRRIFLELAQKELPFREEVVLRPGPNVVRVGCRDLGGQSAAAEVTWRADWQAPGLSLRKVARGKDGWTLQGSCSDDGALAKVTAGGKVLFEGDGRATDAAVEIRGAPGMPVRFTAEDAAGNVLELSLTEEGMAPTARDAGAQYAANEPAGVPDVPAGAPTGDAMKPSLRLSQAAQTLNVYEEEFLVDGDASDGGGLASITINGEELMKASDRGAARQYFLRRVPLDLGTNTLRIVAKDVAGNEAAKSLTLIRREPEYLGEEYRLTVGVPPLVVGSNDAAGDVTTVQSLIEQELLQDPPRFHLLERDEGWDYILREQQLSLSDLADPAAALRIGKMLPAEMLLMGRLLTSGGGLTVQARIVETGTGRIVKEEDVYTEGAEADLPYQISGLVMKIEQHFPLAEGRIVDARGGQATIDVGAAGGVRVGTRFVAIQPETAGEGAGSVCKSGEQVVELKVSRVEKDKSRAQVLPPEAGGLLAAGLQVYTR